MDVLGINAYHAGAAACLIRDGRLVAAAEEERFNRRKYWSGFPVEAIRWVLREAGVDARDVAHVGISRDPNAHLLRKVLFTLSRRPRLDLVRARLANAAKVRDLRASVAAAVGVEPGALRAEFHNVEHHHAHAASAFFVSPFPEAAVISVDGMGDFVSSMWADGAGGRLRVGGAINFPHSLGFFYTALSQWLGFRKYGDEGKVMGLAPYGQPRQRDAMGRIVRLQRDGTFELDLDYFVVHTDGVTMSWDDGEPVLGNLYSSRLTDLLGPARAPEAPLTAYHHDVAASLQAMLEEAYLALVRKVQRETGRRALCLAGGVALNSVVNGKILPSTEFDDIFIQPAAGDAGTALGVCYHIWHQVLGKPRAFVMRDAYTGPAYAPADIEAALERHGLQGKRLEADELPQRAAELVADGAVLGWFQGRMEWGPRALGARSIVADPRRADMKDVLNARIKHREAFRPFAPSVLLEHVGEYFDQAYPDPFMLKVYGVRTERRAAIPAVTHVDGSGRLQTVERETAPAYWALIEAFRARTGVPVVLNTSFNENEPIVCTPDHAIECFLRTRMDALAVGPYLVTRGGA
ncbi:MAG TPA: carbamoyltransferase C-terminal domain-containing protein [Methylomirabilota bacterium]|jgi:carbamoyltransferase